MARILIVDDSKVVRSMVQKALSKAGHEVEEVENAKEALEMIQQSPPDLCILDIEMPGMDGYSLLRQSDGKIPP